MNIPLKCNEATIAATMVNMEHFHLSEIIILSHAMAIGGRFGGDF